ncbi:MAG TPA: HAMP domain-containing sensor histidine kinase [Vicinamibacterales bacterium]|nr:HAMP domain-containing sensor histidine kinase [Vicinamibacterales bacterium]
MTDPNVQPDCPGAAARLLVVARDLATARDVAAVAAVTCAAARDLTSADGVAFVLRDGERCVCIDENAPVLLWKGRTFPLASCVSGWVMTNGQAAVIPDVFADSRVPHEVCRPTPVKSVATVPVGTTDPLAALGAYWAASHHATADEVAALRMLAASAALALDNARLYQDWHAAVQRERDLADAVSVVYGRVELSLETLHVPSLIKQVTEAIGPFMQARQLQFITAPPMRPVWIRADAGRIQQVLMNLLMNAARYTDAGGAVRLSIQHNEGFVTIAVRDNGRGIDPALLPHVFELFTHGAGDRAGSGVGLSVARRLVELHHGRIEARSDGPGSGSEFIVMLPTMAAD